jgi:hypothetical protein
MKLGQDRHITPSACTNCGEILDGATSVGCDGGPDPGDLTICIICGHLMVFDDNLKLRDPTGAEMVDAAGDKRIIAIQLARKVIFNRKQRRP